MFDFPVGDANPNDRVNAQLEINVKCKNIPLPDPSTCPGATRPQVYWGGGGGGGGGVCGCDRV